MQIQILAEDHAGRHLAALGVLLGSVAGTAENAKRVTCGRCGGTGTVTIGTGTPGDPGHVQCLRRHR